MSYTPPNNAGENSILPEQLLKQEIDKHKVIARAVVQAQEKERAEIGKELHDNVNQILSTAKLFLETAKSLPNERLDLIDKSIHSIQHAINEIQGHFEVPGAPPALAILA